MSTLSTTTGEQAFLNIFKPTPKETERRRSLRTPAGSLGCIRQAGKVAEVNPLHVLIMDVSEGGLGLRSPLSLVRNAIYRIAIEDSADSEVMSVKVVSSRRRRDGSYDIGTRYVG
jgi:c-di-GMP-binding flagellar brake protein YcgR